MSVDRVRAYLEPFGLAARVQEFEVSSATVELAAAALGCPPCRIAKTLSFIVQDAPVLIVTAGDARIDNPRYKAQFGVKAKMIPAEETVSRVGHAVGGVCPFDVNDGVRTYLDVSLRCFETVFPACGSANSAIELSIPELERCTRSEGWVDVCKGWRESE